MQSTLLENKANLLETQINKCNIFNYLHGHKDKNTNVFVHV